MYTQLSIDNDGATSSHFLCKNGKTIARSHRCLYNTNANGFLVGCRDASHLEQCGKFFDAAALSIDTIPGPTFTKHLTVSGWLSR